METSFDYDDDGLLIEVDPPGDPDPITYERDDAGRITRITRKNDSGSDVETEIDRDFLGRTTQITYDVNGADLTVTYDHDVSDKYDNNASYGVNVVDTGGVKTQYLYNSAGLLWKVVKDRDGSDTTVTEFAYDAYGNLVELTDAEANSTTFEYDSLDRLTSVTDEADNEKSFTYYPDGSLASRTDQNGIVTEYTYDDDNRLYQIDYNDSDETVTYLYAANGLITSITGSEDPEAITFTYDAINRLSSTDGALTGGTDPDEVAYEYHDDGQREEMTWITAETNYALISNSSALYTITNQNDLVTKYTYNEYTGGISQIYNHGNDTYTDYSFNNLGLLDEYTATLASGGLDYEYDYYSSGLIQKITFPAGHYVEYEYDGVYRLTEEALKTSGGTPVSTRGYGYDDADNRTTQTGALSETYLINALNQITAIYTTGQGTPHTTFDYDYNGAMIEQDAGGANPIEFDYDYENRLIEITYADLTSTEFVYDALGRRLKTIEKTAQGSPVLALCRLYIYDGLDLIAEFDGNGTLVIAYTHGPGIDDPVIMRLSGTYDYFYHKNHLGSVTEITNTNGQVVKTYSYDAFGNLYAETGTGLVGDLSYTGRERHDRSLLYYYRNRFYSPSLGRFLTQDPIGIAGGTNLYTYVGNAPTGYVDPLGLWMERIFNDTGQRAENRDTAISMHEFILHAQGRSLDDLQHEVDQGAVGGRSAAGPKKGFRHVIDPRNPNEVIDMRHMLVVGPQGEIVGLLIEAAQIFIDWDSAFNAQDFLSNAIGDDFFDNHYDPSKPLAPQLKQYFFGGSK